MSVSTPDSPTGRLVEAAEAEIVNARAQHVVPQPLFSRKP